MSKNAREVLQISVVTLLLAVGFIIRWRYGQSAFLIETIIFLSAYFISGYGVIYKAFRNLLRARFFDEQFLMTLATGGAIAIGQIPEGAAVMLFYNLGEYLQGRAVRKNRKSVKALLEMRPDYANLISDDEERKVSPESVRPGDNIIVKPGEKVPLDGIIIKGKSFFDTFALTGESVPASRKEGEDLLSGFINKQSIITMRVTHPFSESSFMKIIDLVENASMKKAETEKFITKFARYYTPVVVIAAAMVAFIPPLVLTGQTFSDWIYRALVILVVSCPCALVISIPLGYLGGIGAASKKGILIKGSVFLDALTELKTIVFDKTGTLTKGVFKVTEIKTFNGFSREEILKSAAYAEYHSGHPIASSILTSYGGEIDHSSISDFHNFAGRGVKAVVNGKTVIAGNDAMLHHEKIDHNFHGGDGTVVHVAVGGKYAGYILISDELHENSLPAIQKLNEWGIKKIMLTGDTDLAADSISDKLGIDEYYSGLLPDQKLAYLEKIILRNKEGKTAFIGDGINDAPVIARADIGFAMGGLGSDAAVEASDIVIMEDDPYKLIDSINIARKTRKVVLQNIFFAIAVKLVFIILGGMGEATMWEAVFGDMGVALLAILNSTRTFK